MADAAHDWTDEQIERLRRRFGREYRAAEREMRGKLDKFLEDYDRQNREWKRRVSSGDAKQEDYQSWLKEQSVNREWIGGMVEELSADALRTDQLAMSYINNEIPTVFAENANRAAHEVEAGIGRDTHSFDLYDRDTVGRLIAEQPELLPPLPSPRIDNGRDLRWNRQRFSSAIAQSVLQGESIPKAAERIGRVMRTNEASATRAARTALTGAENAGRVHSYERAKTIGINLEQEWMATLDQRTRHSHRQLDGQHVPVGTPFKVDGIEIGFPADPTAPAEYVYNCRCTLVAWFPDIEQEDNKRWSKLPKGITYDDWKSGKKAEQKRKEAAGVVEGKDILGTWKRRPDQFDFEIKDVLNAQGFDGKPRVVSAEEFDAAVKAANGGNGFIAQRVYGAPSQEVLEGYRKELYEGSFFVDCSGGSTYGHGMYTASDFTGTITAGIRSEMEYYENAGRIRTLKDVDAVKTANRMARDEARQARRSGDRELSERILSMENSELLERYGLYPKTYTETMTLDPSAKIIDYDTLSEQRREILEEHNAESYIYDLDMGTLATLLGYDAIDATRGRSGHYTVILNRTKLIIRRPE